MDLREQLRIKETAKIRLAAREYDERILVADQAVLTAEAQGTVGDDLETLRLEADNVRRERDLFLWEHDTTGAMKGDRFGADVVAHLEKLGLERGPDGQPRLREGGERSHMILVNMGELDRLNESGEHELGDKALELALEEIQKKVESALLVEYPEFKDDPEALAGKYEIYRLTGNDFSVLIKDADADVAKDVTQFLAGKKLDVTGLHPGEDPAPLTANRLSFADAVAAMGRLEASTEGAESDVTRFITVLKEKVQTMSDYDKVRSRFERIVEKIREPGTSNLSAQTLYDKYLKRSLGALIAESGEEPLEFDRFVEKLKSQDALDHDALGWQRNLFGLAREEAIKQFHSRNQRERENSQRILESVLEDLGKTAEELGIRLPSEAQIEAPSALAGFGEEQERRIAEFAAKTDFLGRTDGEEVLESLKKQTEADFGTGELAVARKRQAELALKIEQAKRDSKTGLPLRGVFFQNLEKRLSSGEPVSVVAIDMAFLKYFDKEGGRGTGDTAILTAARILDYVKRQVKAAHGIDIEACRVGGDEFALVAATADKTVLADIMRRLREAENKTEKIPAYAGAMQTYQPENLQFNIGLCSAATPEEFKTHLRQRGVKIPDGLDPKEEIHFLSNNLSRIADRQVEARKIIGRFNFLLNKSLGVFRAPEAEKASRQLNLKTLMAYSEKAIFGKAGKDKIGQWIPQLLERKTTVAELVNREIIPFVVEELKKKGKEDLKMDEELGRSLEYDLRLTLSEMYIGELEKRLDDAARDLGQEHDRVKQLRSALETTRAEMEVVKGLKSRISQVT